jgi:hypothetical protein
MLQLWTYVIVNIEKKKVEIYVDHVSPAPGMYAHVQEMINL